MDQPLVPAWKRLGLKLKYAQETETETVSSALAEPHRITANGATAADISTNGVNGHSRASPPTKRRRLEEVINESAGVTTNGLTRSSSLKSSGSNIRKSVSFTPETKEVDGESSNFMQDKWDEEARNDQINDFLAREAQNEIIAEEAARSQVKHTEDPIVGVEVANLARKPKRDKNKQTLERPLADSASESPPFTRKSKDALEYLQQYQNSRSTWKFNKNREIWLLKHILSESDIPSVYESALFEYLAGMKSENAKQRMMDQCHDCIVGYVEREADESDRALMSKSLKMDTTQRRLAYYCAANLKFEQAFKSTQLEDVSQKEKDIALTRHERINRAAKLLESLLGSSLQDNGEDGTGREERDTSPSGEYQPLVKGNVTKVPSKKRKNRTAVVDISSSSDSSSESDT